MTAIQRSGNTQPPATPVRTSEVPDGLAGLPEKEQKLRDALGQPVQKGDREGIQKRLRDVYSVLNSLSADEAEAMHKKLSNKGDELGKLFHYKLATPTRNAMLGKLEIHALGERAQTRWETMYGSPGDQIDLKGDGPSPVPSPKPKQDGLGPPDKELLDREREMQMQVLRNLRV